MAKPKDGERSLRRTPLFAAFSAGVLIFGMVATGNAADDIDAAARVYETLTPLLVEVKITVTEDPKPQQEQTALDRHFDLYVKQRVPLRLAGLRVSPQGEILIRDPILPIRRYGGIELTDADNNVTSARLKAVLQKHAGIILEPIEPADAPLPYADFVPADVTAGQLLMIAQPAFIEREMSLNVQGIHAATTVIAKDAELSKMLWWEDNATILLRRGAPPSAPPIVLDDQARILGVMLDSALWSTMDGRDSWIGTSIMQDERLTTAMLETTANRIAERAREAVKEVEIQFRKDSDVPERYRTEKGKLYLYGALIDDKGGILVPTLLDREAIRQIERIIVRQEGQPIVAEFEGMFRSFGAFLIRAEGLEGPTDAVFEDGVFPRGTAFYTLSVRQRYGRRDDDISYNRYLDVQTGYKETSYPVPMMPMRIGDLVADPEGRLLGFLAPLRMEEQDEIRAETDRSYGSGIQARLYLFSDVADTIHNPEGNFDRGVRPMSRKEERGLVWLGVEYQPINAALARALKADGPTRGGARGLLVTHVYKNSPAEKLKIGIGTLLLSIEVPGSPAEIDLVQPQRTRYGRGDNDDFANRIGLLWESRRNHLTTLLTLLGAERPVIMNVFADGQERRLEFALEKAPDDFESADEYTAEILGLSVKQMTYEVRSALRLTDDAPGVVVSKVEPGSKSDIAQVAPYEIVLAVNGKPVSSPTEFEVRMRAAENQGRAELLVERLGQSHIVEIDLQDSLL